MASTNDVNVLQPIDIVLDGSNYNAWAQQMSVFLIGRRFWHFVTGDKTEPKKADKETADDFADCLEVWEATHCKILSWFINTSVPSIISLLPKFRNAHLAWEFLANRYNCASDATLQFQLESKLYQMHQQPGQSIAEFHSQVSSIWDQLSQANPSFPDAKFAVLFSDYRDRRQFIHFMMRIRDDFKNTRAFLLHRSPLPTLDITLTELISEET